jgi:hypothetical protein
MVPVLSTMVVMLPNVMWERANSAHCTRYVEAYMRQQPPFVDEFLTVTIPHTQVASLWWSRAGDNGCWRR